MGFNMKKPSIAIGYGGESNKQQKKNLMTKDPIPEHASALNNLNKGYGTSDSMAKMNGSPFHKGGTGKKEKPTGSLSLDVNKNLGVNIDKVSTVQKIDTTGVKGSDKFASSTLGKSSDSKDIKDAKRISNDKTQSVKNTATRKSGKAVSYKDAYADADKSKYKTEGEFVSAAKDYNKKKYDTTEPTKVAKEKGITKKNLAEIVTKYGPSKKKVEVKATTITASEEKGDASTRKGRKAMKNTDKAEGRSTKEVKSLKLQRKAKAASDADPTSKKAARLEKRSQKREKRINK